MPYPLIVILVLVAIFVLPALLRRSGKNGSRSRALPPMWVTVPPGAVVLEESGPNKIATIKVLREMLRVDLKHAKDLVDCVPQIISSNGTAMEAERLRRALEAVGATVRIEDQFEDDDLEEENEAEQPRVHSSVSITVNGKKHGVEWLKENPGIQEAIQKAFQQKADLFANGPLMGEGVKEAFDKALGIDRGPMPFDSNGTAPVEGQSSTPFDETAGSPFESQAATSFEDRSDSPFEKDVTDVFEPVVVEERSSSGRESIRKSEGYSVVLTDTGLYKSKVLEAIGELRPDLDAEATNDLGKPGFTLTIKQGLSRSEAERCAEKLEEAGAAVRIER